MAANLIIGLACLSIAVMLWALGVLLVRWKRTLPKDAKRLLVALLIVSMLHEVSNLLEWRWGGNVSMPFEDYFLLILPAVWGVFFYAFLQAQSRANLRRSQERYRSLTDDVLDTTAAGICILDADRRVVWINKAVEEYFDLKRNEIVGQHGKRLIEDRLKRMVDDREEFAVKMSVACASDQVSEIECHVLPGETRQERWLECRAQPVHFGLYAGGRITHFYDITERKKAAEQRERLLKVLEVQKAELERFVYTVSHDLKSPLITIQGFLGILEENLTHGNSGEARTDIERIEKAADRMQRLLNELLDLARVGRDRTDETPVNLAEVIADALEHLQTEIERRAVAVVLGDGAPVIWGHRIRLVEVFQNLIDNSIKYLGDQPQPRIEIGAEAGETEVTCFVRDNGIGIDARYEAKVFELFEQLNPDCEGTGVGLAIVKRIVETHGGRIWLESQGTGQGTTFWFTLSNGEPPKTAAKTANQAPSLEAKLPD